MSEAFDTPGAIVYDDRREHFGFVDGISQPVLAGLQKADDNRRDVVNNGEFVLEYTNEYGYRAEAPSLGPKLDLGRNGTYLVYRQTSQDVRAFQDFLDAAGNGEPGRSDFIGAEIVGRWKSGAPLVKAPQVHDPAYAAHHARGNVTLAPANDFGFAEDPKGFACPLGSHIRRANPRDGSLHTQSSNKPASSARHRLLRRGRSYGTRYARETAQEERGLHFIALCADIERQFEFVQQTWINNPAFNDLDEIDPMVGGSDPAATFTIQASPLRERVTGLKNFVTLRGGAYFFVPSIRALRWLATIGER